MDTNPAQLLLHPRGLPPGWTRAEAREALWTARDAALAVLLRVHDGETTCEHVHGVARWVIGLGAPHLRVQEEQAALLEAWAGRIARAGLRLGQAAVRRPGQSVAGRR